jgi:NAD(P)-dependent dehydrogenase (short-subunit alcohol dehydrogenase family)
MFEKIILVTGGASGLGLAITKRLAQDSSNFIYFTYNSSEKSAVELQESLKNTKGIHLDFRDEDAVDQFADRLFALNPDVLVNNGLTGFMQSHFHKLNASEFLSSFKFNVLPVIKITQSFIVLSRKRKSGRIVTILSSSIINKPPIGWSEYCANKSYLHMISKSWATENRAFGIISNCISPSFMRTNLTKAIDERLIASYIESNPNNSLLDEKEVADAVHFFVFASPQINGTNLLINAASDII